MSDTQLNDAEIFGDLEETFLNRTISIALGSKRNHPDDQWKNQNMTIGQLIVMLSRHGEGPKDGPCFLQSEVVGGIRRGNAVRAMHLMVLDMDTGENPEPVLERIDEMGLFCIAYSTHSNMKDETEISKSALVAFVGGEREPTLEDAVAFLQTKKHYQPHILEAATMLPLQHTPMGVMVVIKHAPMPKFRLLFLLDKPFVIADRHPDPKRSIIEWKNRYAGVSVALGVHFDQACVDPTRLFYTPRHPKGSPFWINVLAGRPLKIENYAEITAEELRKMALDPFTAEAEGAGREYKTPDLKKFVAKYAKRFRVTDFLHHRGLKSLGKANGGETFNPCPFEGEHSNPGDDIDKGFWVVDGDGDRGFTMKCHHNGCAGRDRMDFLDGVCQMDPKIVSAQEILACDAVDQEADEPDDYGWNDLPDGTPGAIYQKIAREMNGFTSVEEASAAIKACDPADLDSIGNVMHRIGISEFEGKAPQIARDKLLNEAARHTKLSKRALTQSVRAAMEEKRQAVEKTGEAGSEKELIAFDKRHALVSMNGQIRIMEYPEHPGHMPVFYTKHDFHLFTANERTVKFDAEGKMRSVPIAEVWEEWPDRTAYKRVVFEPEWTVAECQECGAYNIWHGFPVQPDGSDADWNLLHTHIFKNICQGEHDYYVWLMTWIAQIFQQPGTKLGSAVAIRGKKGVGKSTLFYWLQQALGIHCIQVSQREHITGKFNAHMTNALLMVCEEAFWAGDQASGNVLKNLITNNSAMVEKKGVDAISLSNYVRLALVSNEDWIVPAGLDDERRYFVLECADTQKGNTAYFEKIAEQMENGGVAAMVKTLMEWNPQEWEISCYNDETRPMRWDDLRNPPKTIWLTQQGVESLHAADSFFMDIAKYGAIGSAVGPGDAPIVNLHPTQPTEVELDVLSFHFDNFMSKTYGGKQYLGKRDKMLAAAQNWLLTEDGLYRSGSGDWKTVVIVPPLNKIHERLRERGIAVPKIIDAKLATDNAFTREGGKK